jgi:hypothetical protein
MRIRYTPPHDLELAASEHELQQLARALAHGRNEEFRSEPHCSPEPYERVLEAIQVRVTSGPAEVRIHESTLWLSGSASNLDRLSSFFSSVAPHEHAHFEWFPGNEFVSESSVPLVIAHEASTPN